MTYKSIRLLILLVTVIGITALAGCSNHVQLTGKVTFSDDGSPLGKGTICFTNGATMSRGEIKSDGTYVMSTNKEGDGLPPGPYQVYIYGADEIVKIGNDPENFMESTRPLIAEKYSSAATSELTCTVDRSTKTFDVQVDRYQSNARRR